MRDIRVPSRYRLGLMVVCWLLPLPSLAQEGDKAPVPFPDEPEAHALYDAMVEAMREAKTLSWVADYQWEVDDMKLAHVTYKIWLKKPNFARMEAGSFGSDQLAGILVGDGDHFWIYWPNGKIRYPWENSGEFAAEYEKHKNSFYMKKPTPLGRHSLGHEAAELGSGITMPILDPSTFHGYTDSLQPYIDGIRSLGPEAVGDEECDVIEVSFMKYQRSWTLWLSILDGLPRKLDQVVRVSKNILTHEVWSDVLVNEEVSDELFSWKPPEGWKEWSMPPIEAGLLKPGTEAPDFELTSTGGGKIKLSDYRGSYVWLNKWRCG
ncbi:MAG: DUF2092 domain-containing protein [Planctomycetota bacterium]